MSEVICLSMVWCASQFNASSVTHTQKKYSHSINRSVKNEGCDLRVRNQGDFRYLHSSFSTLRVFHNLHFPHSAFRTFHFALRIPKFAPHSSFSTIREYKRYTSSFSINAMAGAVSRHQK